VTGFRIYTSFWLRPTGAASTAASAVSAAGAGCIRYRRQSILVRRYPLPAYLLASSKVTGTALRVPWICGFYVPGSALRYDGQFVGLADETPTGGNFPPPFVSGLPWGRDAGFLCFPPLISSKKNRSNKYP